MLPFFYHQEIHRAGIFRDHFSSKRMILCCFLLFLLFVFTLPLSAESQNEDLIRIGFSASFFEDINQNDAIAAIRAWTKALLNKEDVSAVPKPHILSSIPEIRELLSNDQLDYISLTTKEYAKVSDLLTVETITVSQTSNRITEEYLLLVNRDSGIESLKDLEGRNLQLVRGSRMSMSMIWLDTILLREKLSPAAEFFGSIGSNKNAQKVILPIFFNKGDACVVTRTMFDTLVELNPQIGRRLKTISMSPSLVPSFFSFTRSSGESLRKKVTDEISRWNLSPFGKQSLIIFQCDGLKMRSISCLDSALKMIEEHKRLLNATKAVNIIRSPLS